MISGLLTLVVLAVVQLALALWVRTVLIDAAGAGARVAAMAESSLGAGTGRATEVAAMGLGTGYVETASASREERWGYDVVEVRLTAPLPIVGLLGPSGSLTVTGHAVAER